MWRIRAPLLALLLMQVVLLASAGATAVKKPLGKQDTCNMKNHMIEYLRNNGVQIYERPQIRRILCPAEWVKHGTCCDPVDVRQYLNQKIRLNIIALDTVIAEIRSIARKLQRFKTSQDQLRTDNGITFLTASSLNNSTIKAQNMQSRINEIGKAIINNQQTNVRNQQKCVAKINSVISKSACSICSGRSDDFFNNANKLMFSEPLCREVLADCTPAWTSMIEIASDVSEYTQTVRKLHSFDDEDGIFEEKAFTMNLDSFITNRNLIPILQSCKGASLVTCPFEHVAALCEQFIHIQAPTYIESSQSQAQKIHTEMKAAVEKSAIEIVEVQKNLEVMTKLARQKAMRPKPALDESMLETIKNTQQRHGWLRRCWTGLQTNLPRLQTILQTSGQIKSQNRQEIEKTISRAQARLTQIQNTIAVAALRIHTELRALLIGTTVNPDIKLRAESSWNTLMVILEGLQHPTYTSQTEQEIFSRLLETRQEKKAAASPPTKAAVKAEVFNNILRRGVVSKIKELLSPPNNTTDTTNVDQTAMPLIPAQEITEAERDGRILFFDTKLTDIQVTKDCKPCVGSDSTASSP